MKNIGILFVLKPQYVFTGMYKHKEFWSIVV